MATQPKAVRKSKQASHSPRDTREAPSAIPDGAPGTTDQLPRWEGPPETRPRGYLPALDDPSVDRDAAGENLQNSEGVNHSDHATHESREDRIRRRAYHLWEKSAHAHGSHEDHWRQASREIDEEDR